MTTYRLPKELRSLYLYHVSGIDLIEQCTPNISTICDDENFWKDKLLYDYTIGLNNPMYTEYDWMPYQWYVLFTYGLKYDPYLLYEYDGNGDPTTFKPIGDDEISEGVFEFLTDPSNDKFLPQLAFKNNDADVIDVYMTHPDMPISVLLGIHNEDDYIKTYKYIWDNDSTFHNVLLILDIINEQWAGWGFWKEEDDDDVPIILSRKDLPKLMNSNRDTIVDYTDDLVDIYERQFEYKEADTELCRYLEDLQQRVEEEE